VIERGAAEADRAFVLLHGWGAPGDDLVSLADELAALSHRPMRVIVPAAPIAMRHGGRAWYDLHADDATRQAARARGSIEAVVRTLGERGVAPEHVIVGGFSQGAILSIELALVGQPRVGGIAVLSGRALEHPARTYRALEHLPIFQSHGRSDDRIPFARGEAFREAATRAGASVEHVPFEGGHAIPPVVVTALAAWLERTLA
jgi:phospholipase/carboxylesterase